jgi:ectoine hydroxylase-related dioxygenase (phytanoyl-CoA dioxygenase family)
LILSMQAANNGAKLAELRDSLERDGYAVLDLGLDDAVLERAVAEIEPLFRPEGSVARTVRRARRALLGRHTAISHRDERRVQDAWIVSPDVRAIAMAPAVLELLAATYGRRPLAFQTLNFKYGSEQRPHSDAMHFNSEPSGFMCGVWLALEDIGPDQGPVVYFPGSHRLPEVTAGEIEGDHDDYEEFVAEVIDREGLEESRATLRRGEALIWSANLIHGGSPQNDRSLTRWSQVTHYFFEGCRYWKPLASHGGERAYWEPTWVR